MATQLATSTSQYSLGLASIQNRVGMLWDGSLIFIDFDGTNSHLYQVTALNSSPVTTSVQTFAVSGSNSIPSDIFVLDNGNSSNDIWILYSGNSGTPVPNIAHATYNASGTWSWDNTGSAISTSPYTVTFEGGSLVWTGSYLVLWFSGYDSSTGKYGNYLMSTGTKAGTGTWTGATLMGTAYAYGHAYPQVHYDSNHGYLVAIYSTAQDNLYAQLCNGVNGIGPSPAHWGTAVTIIGSNSINIGAGEFSALLDSTTGQLHIVWCDSTAGTTKSPGYINSSSISGGGTGSTIAFNTAIAIGTASTLATYPQLCMGYNGTLYIAWATTTTSALSDIMYATLASPYTSVSGPTNLTSAAASNNITPIMMERRRPSVGFIPIIYQKLTASPYSLMLDSSLPDTRVFTQSTSGLGTDSISTAPVAVAVSPDTAIGSEVEGSTTTLTINEAGNGSDGALIAELYGINDSAVGSESNIAITLPISDTGSGQDLISSIATDFAVILPVAFQEITDNIARTLLDLESAYITNFDTSTPNFRTILLGQGDSSNSLTSRIAALGDIQQIFALAHTSIDTANQIASVLSVSPNSFYMHYGPLLYALEQNTNGVASYLAASNMQVHVEFAKAFNFVANHFATLNFGVIRPIPPTSVFVPTSTSLASFTASGATSGTTSILGTIDPTLYAPAPLYITVSLGIGSRIGNISLQVYYTDNAGNPYVITYTQIPANGKLALGVTGSLITNLILTAGGISGDTYLITGEPLRIPSY